MRCLSEVSGRKLSKQLERCYEDMKSVQDPAYLQSLEVANVGIIVSASLVCNISFPSELLAFPLCETYCISVMIFHLVSSNLKL